MSQRDALLEGAKKCLVEKGYSGTTARDIAAASGAHLASIGYHFGSKDRLMNVAAIELTGEWGDSLEHDARAVGGDDAAERLAALVSTLVAELPANRDLQRAGLAAVAQAPFDESLRAELAPIFRKARSELAAVILGVEAIEEGSDAERGLGALVHAILAGLGVQAVTDPDALPSPEVAAAAVRALSGR